MEIGVINSNERKTTPKTTQTVPATTITTTVVKQALTPTTRFPTLPTYPMPTSEMTEGHVLSTHSGRTLVKPTNTQKNATSEQMQTKDRLPGEDQRKDRNKYSKETTKAIQTKMLKL